MVLVVKNLSVNAGDVRDTGSIPASGGRRARQSTPVSLPGESHGSGEPGRLQSIGSHRLGHDCSDLARMHA